MLQIKDLGSCNERAVGMKRSAAQPPSGIGGKIGVLEAFKLLMLETFTIAVAHEFPMVLLDICAALAQVGRYQIVGGSSDPAETLQLVSDCHPQLLILDSRLGGIASQDWLAFLRRTEPQMKVLLLTEEGAEVPGVAGVLGKGEPVQVLIQTVEKLETQCSRIVPLPRP